ncbi:hypothetical protein QYE76_009128 [Lolium multiflorum]|uniref:F-box domain-containing protein n=1 Tax=Lolium multiflorum TaxID=4521 RepID=A0AAD8X0Y6_LOLMU|nr:hypothetical protein QYE76_009128 [Lolium multiflorum]
MDIYALPSEDHQVRFPVMAASKSEGQSAWPDLPPELLGAVLRLLPSLADRVRLRAVCRQWRNSAIVFPPSHLHLPWLGFTDGTLLDVVNNAAHRVRIPDDAVCYSAGENTFFLVHDDGRCSLVDLFYGGTATPLPELAALLRASKVDPRYELLQPVHKVVVSTSSAELEEDCRLVAVIIRGGNVIISTCRPAGETNACLALDNYFNFSIADIVFFQGRMYALAKVHEALHALDLNKGRIDQLPALRPPGIEVIPGAASAEFEMIQEPHLQEDPWPYGHEVARRYLVESNGKLLMIRRWIRKSLMSFSYYAMTEFHDADGYDRDRTRRFEVFEIGHGQWNSRRRWHKVQSLHGQALFVSSPCSKAAPAADHGAQQDCIYFSHQFYRRKMDDPLGDSGVYSMRDGTITRPLLPEPAAVSASLPWRLRFPTWVFPVEA